MEGGDPLLLKLFREVGAALGECRLLEGGEGGELSLLLVELLAEAVAFTLSVAKLLAAKG